MSSTTGKPKRAGFTSTISFLKALSAYKEERLKPPFEATKFRDLDIPEGNRATLLHTFRDLELIDVDGYPTETLKDLAHAYQSNQAEYQKILQELLQKIYAEVFQLIPIKELAQATPLQFNEAFANFVPKQQRKMIALFRGLCREAGLLPNEDIFLHSPDGKFIGKAPKTGTQSNGISPITDTLFSGSPTNVVEEPAERAKKNGSTRMQPELDLPEIEEQRNHLQRLLRQLPVDAEKLEQERTVKIIAALKADFNYLLELLERKD